MVPVVKPGEVVRELRRFDVTFGNMTREEQTRWADAVLEERSQWIKETLAINRWIALRDWLSYHPLLWWLGKGAWQYYEESHPERVRDLQDAAGIKLGTPLASTIWSDLNRGALRVDPLLGEDDDDGSNREG